MGHGLYFLDTKKYFAESVIRDLPRENKALKLIQTLCQRLSTEKQLCVMTMKLKIQDPYTSIKVQK